MSTPALSLENVTCTFVSREDRAQRYTAVRDVTLSIQPGEFVALVGASGSGKSTLFRLLLGFESPESGAILYDGQELTGLDVRAEISSVEAQKLGDTVLLWDDSQLAGLAVCHSGAGSEAGSGKCYMKFAAVRPDLAGGRLVPV